MVNPVSLIMLVSPVVIIVLCMMRKHLITALAWGFFRKLPQVRKLQ